VIVARDVGADLLHALGDLHEHRHLGGGLGELVLVEIGELAGEALVGLVDGGLVDVQVDEPRLEVELQRGALECPVEWTLRGDGREALAGAARLR
jgi:hypothetical protein